MTGPPRRDLGVPIATMILDPDLTPIDASAAALELIGATMDELRRLPPGGLAAEPDAAESAIALRDTWKASGNPELGGETTIRRLDGRRVRVKFGLTPMDDGRFLAILEPVATPVERPDVIYTAGQVLAEWRAAERRMTEVPQDSPEGRRIRADIEVFRARYQDVFRSNSNRPRASTSG
jgi:PAS domain-containing protein